MIIEYGIKHNEKVKLDKNIYQIGNIIENNGAYFLISTLKSKIIVLELRENDVYGIYDSLHELQEKFPENGDKLVEAKLVIKN